MIKNFLVFTTSNVRSHKVYPDKANKRKFVIIDITNHLELQKFDAKSKDFQRFIFSSEQNSLFL